VSGVKILMSRIDEYKATIATYQKLIAEIQEQCSHPAGALEKEHGGGETDSPWVEFHCTLCEKVWVEDAK